MKIFCPFRFLRLINNPVYPWKKDIVESPFLMAFYNRDSLLINIFITNNYF